MLARSPEPRWDNWGLPQGPCMEGLTLLISEWGDPGNWLQLLSSSIYQICLVQPCIVLITEYQFSSVTQSCLTLRNPMNRNTPGLPVHHQLPEFTQTHVHRVSDAIQPSHPWSSPSSPAPNPSQHQSLFQWVNYTFNKSQWNVCINSRVKFLPVLFFKDMWTGQLLLDSFKISMTEEESFYKQQPLQNTALTTVNRQSYRTTHYSGTESS